MTTQVSTKKFLNGPAAAALLSSAIGCLTIGLLTTGAVISESLNNALNWWGPAGPLSGKTGIGIIVWLISWAILHNRWKEADVNINRIFTWMVALLLIGLALTFPPVFEAFE